MAWKYGTSSFVWIFPVGRGNCAFLRTGLNHGFILDMGSEHGFDISGLIRRWFVPDLTPYPGANGPKIAQVVLSHPHADHITNCAALAEPGLRPHLITCPSDKTPGEEFDWDRHGNPDSAKELLGTYKALYAGRNPPLQSVQYDGSRSLPNLEYGLYYVRPPACARLHPSDDNKYGNATSVMFYFRHGCHSALFPGDMTPEGMKLVLADRAEKRYTRFYGTGGDAGTAEWHLKTGTQPSLASVLGAHGLTVLLAPHHGLESCYSPELYAAINAPAPSRPHKPDLVVASERRKRHENDGDTDGRYYGEQGGVGVRATVEGREERVPYLGTKGGLHVLAVFHGTGKPLVFAHTDPYALLREVKLN